MLILYHGSYTEIRNPNISFSRNNVDFGKGFYLTPIYDQAINWCRRFKDKGKNGVVSRYTLDETMTADYKVLKFDSYSEAWLDFIIACRNGSDASDYDIVMGGIANDRVFNTIELYLEKLIDKKETLKRLKYEKPNFQIALRNQELINKYLHFEGSDTV